MNNAINTSDTKNPLLGGWGALAVIGAGTMGNGIAHVFAQNGFAVTLIDISALQLEKAIAAISKNFDRQVAKGTITEEAKAIAMANISTATSIAEGVNKST